MGEKKQAIPEMSELEENLKDSGGAYVSLEGYSVAQWRAGPAYSNEPCTQVHLILPVGDMRFVLRLKSARALDELVGVLLAHRKDVWGEPSS